MKIPYVNLKAQWDSEKKEILPIIEKTFSKGQFVNGSEINQFEKNISKVCGTKYAVALNSGTDALTLGMHLLGVRKGDEVITPPNSFISSTSSICHLGAKPVFVDVLDDQNINPDLIEKNITKRTKAIMPVHLTGRIAEMNEIKRISKRYNIPIIEDAAQSVGSKYYKKKAGSFGEIGCFSAHPLKNLNACGDSGYITTNNSEIYKKAKEARNNGIVDRNIVKKFSYLSRMDVLQANILNYRLKKLNMIIKKRRENSNFYLKNLDRNKFHLIDEKKYQFNTYHTFVIQIKKRNRNRLIEYLNKNGISTAIHYPIPIHLQPASKFLGYKYGDFPVTEAQAKKILTIPVNQNLKLKQLRYIANTLNNF